MSVMGQRKPARPEPPPEKDPGGQRDNSQGDRLLPIHPENLAVSLRKSTPLVPGIDGSAPRRLCLGMQMRGTGWMGMILGVAIAGCGSKPGTPSQPRVLSRPVPAAQIHPLDSGTGTIHSVNSRLRFVVVDFALSIVPRPGQLLEAIRDGRTVGELKVTGPAQGSVTVADLVAGEPQAGDTVRPK